VDRDGRHCFVKVCGADSTLFCEGLDGKDGVDGQDGVDGKRGRPGKNGLDGAPGTPGPKGETGPQGQAAPPAEPTPPATESHKWRASCHGNGNWSPEGTRQHADDVACGRIVVAGCTPTGKLWDGESQGVVGASCK